MLLLIGLDGGLAVPLGQAVEPDGLGAGVRVGVPLDIGPVEVTPEVGGAWFGTVLPSAGGRVVFGERTRPGAYAHVLFPLDSELRVHPGWDAGVTLDVGQPRTVGWGVQLGAMGLDAERASQELAFVAGLHLTLRP